MPLRSGMRSGVWAGAIGFVERVNEVLQRLEGTPTLYPIWPGTEVAPVPIRKALLEQFPYLVAFELHAESVLVLAIAHAKRQPLY